MQLLSTTLIGSLWPAVCQKGIWRSVTLAVLGTFLLTLSAKIQIPLWPVKISMQSFVVIMIGALYGRYLGFATIALYLMEGALGLPVFQGTPDRGLGIPYMLGPTAGYLFGFLLSVYGVGSLAEKGWGKTIFQALGIFVYGAVLIDLLGLSWLTIMMGWDIAYKVYLSYQMAFVFKTGLGMGILPLLWKYNPTSK